MNKTELQRVQDDLDQGIMVCSATIRRVVAHALAQEAQQHAASPSKQPRETVTLAAAWESLVKVSDLRPINSADDYDAMVLLGDRLADEFGDDENHPLFPLFSIVMTLIGEWEACDIHASGEKSKIEVFPIREDLLRHMFEKRYGPKNDFAWKSSDGKYKNEALQHAWTLWEHAVEALTMHLTGVWSADEDCAVRLRSLCKLVGINDQVPEDNDDLWTNVFSVLGMIRRELKERK